MFIIVHILVPFRKIFFTFIMRPYGFNLCVIADIQWVPEDRVTLFTSDGLIQIGGSLVPRRITASEVPNLSSWTFPVNCSF